MSVFAQSQSLIFSPQIQALAQKLHQTEEQMEQFAKEGKYILAENYRINAEQIKKQIDSKRITEVKKRQNKENKQVKHYLKDDLTTFHRQWDAKTQQYAGQSKKTISQFKIKQKQDWEQAKTMLQAQIPMKGKESSECLNLRKIQQNLAKQQNYVQAHLVQKKLKELQQKEQEAWEKLRAQKIEKQMAIVKSKQQGQLKVLEKKIATGAWGMQLQRTKAEANLVLKHSAVTRQLQSQNKKENLMTKGQLKSRVDVLSPTRSILSPSKSRILSSTSQSKLFPTMTR